MKTRVMALGLVLLAATAALSTARAAGCDPANSSTWPASVKSTQTIPGFADARFKGLYAASAAPKAVVAMFHGYGNDSRSWACHLAEAATHGAIAFALDYDGTSGPFRDTRGWFVSEGANDSNELTEHFLGLPGVDSAISFGISMGGNASGLAVARSDIYDYWFNVEGVTNLAQEYVIARGVAPVNGTAADATADIEIECGGAIEAEPDCYRDLSVVAHAEDFAANGLQGAVMVHAVDDGLVPHGQSREITAELRALGIPVEMTTPVVRDDTGSVDNDGGTTFTQNVGNPLFEGLGIDPYPRPLAGHAWEGSRTHIVSKTAFDRLYDLLEGGPAPANADTVVNGNWTP